MESKGKYVWDPDKQAWVRPTERKPDEDKAEPAQSAANIVASDEPVESVVSSMAEEDAVQVEEQAEWTEYKGALIRGAGIVIDFVILIVVNAVIAFIVDLIVGTETVANGTDETVSNLPSWFSVILGFIYFVGLWAWRGQTLGKMIIRAKIVKADGSRIGPINALLRFAFYLVPVFAPILYLANILNGFLPLIGVVIGIVIIALSSTKRGLHDIIAGTYVVDSRPAEPVYEAIEAEEAAD